MRSQNFLLLPLSRLSSVAAHLISNLDARTPGFPETSFAAVFPPAFPTTSPSAADFPSSFPTTTSSPAQILQQCGACQVVGQALAICVTLTPNFTVLQTTAQAKCLCYSSTVWAPNVFDNAVNSCANYALTAAPAAYGALSNLENFCGNVGDVASPVTVFTLAATTGDGSRSGDGGAGITSAGSYVAVASTGGAEGSSPSSTMTRYYGAGATSTTSSGSGSGSSSGSGTGSGNGSGLGDGSGSGNAASMISGTGQTGQTGEGGSGGSGKSSPSKTSTTSTFGTSITTAGLTITIGGTEATATGNASSVARVVLPELEVVWLSFAIALLIVFL